jgi:predicted DCC family thiol-disulfide oxidoreductase YuxK
VAWVKRRDVEDRLHAMPFQDAPRPPMTDRLAQRCARAVHVITPEGNVLSGGRATLYALDQIGWHRTAGLCSRPPLLWLVEGGYWLVARRRGLLSRLFR